MSRKVKSSHAQASALYAGSQEVHHGFQVEFSVERESRSPMHCLVAHCPTSGCYMRVPICTLATDIMPDFDPTLYVAVTCHSCGKEFRELASLLESSPQAAVTGKFLARHKPAPSGIFNR
jgi:hypothetical protein